MELDFDKFCVIDGSPTTVLKPPRNSSKAAGKKSSVRPKNSNDSSRVSKDFREITFNRYRSASCRDARSGKSNEECINDSALLKKRGSVYQSSKEISFLKKNDCNASERKKIEFSRGTVSEISIGIIDTLCTSEDNQCSTSSSCKNEVEALSELSSGIASSRPFRPEVRLSSSKRASDPSVKSKYNRSPLGSVNRSSTVASPDNSMEVKSKVKPRPYDGTSPAHLQGVLKIHYIHGVPSFEFSVKSPEELYIAKTWKVENELTQVYTFHSLHYQRRKSNASGWGHRDSCRESNVLGQMHTSCYLSTEFDRSENDDTMVTEFVLYDVSGQSKPIPLSDLQPVQETAAIVLEAPVEKRRSLKFDEGISDISNRGTMHVVVPCGSHGSPLTSETNTTTVQGPNRLLQRWRLGGGCDCGGWDMACPLYVLRNSNPKPRNDRSPVEIFHLGKKDDIPAFSMRWAQDGKYAVNFHARLSSLQAFSICVAILHSAEESSVLGHDRSIGSKQTLQSDSLRVFPEEEIKNLIDALSSEEEDKLKLEKKRQQAQSFLVIPPFSPIARV